VVFARIRGALLIAAVALGLRDAVRVFYGSGVDVLVLDHFLLTKSCVNPTFPTPVQARISRRERAT